MSHAYERLVADRTDPFRPIPKQRTRQEIHKEAVTGNNPRQVKRNTSRQTKRNKEINDSDWQERDTATKSEKRERKKGEKKHKRSNIN